MYAKRRLLIGRLYRHEPDIRTPNRFTHGFGIVVVILAAFTVWFDELDCDNPHVVAELFELTSPVVSTAAGLEADQTGRALGHEREQLSAIHGLAVLV